MIYKLIFFTFLSFIYIYLYRYSSYCNIYTSLSKYDVFLNKYAKLMDKLNEYSISRFNDDSIVEEFFMVDKYDKSNIHYISVYMNDAEEFNIIIEVKDKYGEYVIIEDKKYKTINGAYNKIKKVLG